jgi:hypothetical protein
MIVFTVLAKVKEQKLHMEILICIQRAIIPVPGYYATKVENLHLLFPILFLLKNVRW